MFESMLAKTSSVYSRIRKKKTYGAAGARARRAVAGAAVAGAGRHFEEI